MAAVSTLHLLFDPLCGWCYAAAPLIEAARATPGLAIALHSGGMLAVPRAVTPQWRDYVMPQDERIAELSGQAFGEAYFEGLLRDEGAVLDSAPPTTAILAAEAVAGRGLDMLHRVQRAHYVEGRRIADPAQLRALALELELDERAFDAAFERLSGEATTAHFRSSRQWLARTASQGFPTLILEGQDGTLTRIDPIPWLGKPSGFAAALREKLLPATDKALPLCDANGCTPSALADQPIASTTREANRQ